MTDTTTPLADAITATPAIDIQGLTKTYITGFWMNKKVSPLKDCSLLVQRGETYGLLGPNGAGKTTTIKCLLGIVAPSGGSGTLLGQPLGDQNIKQNVGYLPENAYFYDYLTAWEFLHFAGEVFRIPHSILKDRIPQLLERVGLAIDTARKKQLRTYSKGMLQRTGMAQALINDPDLVFLDEPMSGLDPIGRYQMREIIVSLKQEGKTVFFNSHILADVEAICDRIGLLVAGKLVAQGSLNEVLGISETYQVRGQGGDVVAFRERLQGFELQRDHWHGEWQGSPHECMELLRQAGATVTDINLRRQSLEEFFVSTVRSVQGKEAGISS
ncbi:MAG: ABC transporter ATP-binding protein [Synechococcaceae cyanobacterium SM2_3_2]|nr:ABC transporter ATP-binding protein [Synechococcaceae cyanobacterium SM2_3_2]